ncbi:DNA repair protein REV1 [Chelonus insularis]|uniref:DNA repair protein REV1 n=1 Tax=Chelonus insularis TaxID=460826 RepID=UPI00158F3604|nr:DNA repair protein REV1 [Chelonus insularis]
MSRKKKKEAWAENGLEDWGSYMAAKKAKLEDQFQEAAESEFSHATDLFRGIAIFVNGYTNPCADELKRLMMEYGGIYHHYLRSGATTHLIASNLPYSKIIQYRKSKNPLPLCKPEWITDSIKANKLLDWRPYLLYNQSSITQPQLKMGSKSNQNCTKETQLNNIKEVQDVSGPSNSIKLVNDISKSTNLKEETFKIVNTNMPNVAVKEQKSHGAALCSKNEEFLTEFYNNSRLHHISTMGATFKEYVNELRSKNTGSFPGLERLKELSESQRKLSVIQKDLDSSDEDIFDPPVRLNHPLEEKDKKESIIMHIDMDCFFVSVGIRNKPELKGLPIAVTHARGNKPAILSNINDEEFISMAEIASCSYEARKAGIKNGMFLGQALKLCPNLKTIKYDFEGYKEVSYILYNTVASYTLDIEAVSCDEMYADISLILQQCNLTPLEFAAIIREEIKQKTGCPVSTGFGSNKLQARLATKKAKPDGQFYLRPEDVRAYIGAIKVQDIPGVGYSTMHQLRNMNVKICYDLQEIPLNTLQKEFGKKTGEMLYNTCRGIDYSKLSIEHIRKSVSAEVNYGIRFENDQDAREFLKKLSTEVGNRLMKANAKGRCITLKLMVRAKNAPKDPAKFMGHGICDNFTKSKNLLVAVDDEIVITREALSLWEQMQQPADDIRGIGIQISRLEIPKKITDTSMVKFIAKGKTSAREIINNELKKPEQKINTLKEASSEPKIIERKNNDINIKTNGSNEKKTESNVQKPQGLDAYFKVKKPSTSYSKPSSSRFPAPTEIDKAVLNELPEDIRMEIINYHKNEVVLNSEDKNNKLDDCLKSLEPVEQCNSAIKNNHSHFENKITTPEVDSDDEIIPCSQQIDTNVSTKLSGNCKTKELALKQVKKKLPQATDYFKEVKPRAFTKPNLPNVKEIDMQVLIELPDDIRNEILNHYKSSNNEKDGGQTSEVDIKATSAINSINVIKSSSNEKAKDREKSSEEVRKPIHEMSVSFSQVDPDFLAGLSEDIKNDVKMYCMAKKREKEIKMKKPLTEEATTSNGFIKPMQNILPIKRRGRKPKNMKIVNDQIHQSKVINNTKNHVQTLKGKKKAADNKKKINGSDIALSKRRSFLENEISILQDDIMIDDKGEAIKSHQLNFQGWNIKNEHQEMLTNLVNYLFSLPLYQVKNQIQTWIANSTHVNDIDTLSIATFLSMLPKERRIEDLHILMKTMYRCMTKSGSCVWHETYRKSVEHVQHYMQIEYNSNLMLPSIKCNICGCKN